MRDDLPSAPHGVAAKFAGRGVQRFGDQREIADGRAVAAQGVPGIPPQQSSILTGNIAGFIGK